MIAGSGHLRLSGLLGHRSAGARTQQPLCRQRKRRPTIFVFWAQYKISTRPAILLLHRWLNGLDGAKILKSRANRTVEKCCLHRCGPCPRQHIPLPLPELLCARTYNSRYSKKSKQQQIDCYSHHPTTFNFKTITVGLKVLRLEGST